MAGRRRGRRRRGRGHDRHEPRSQPGERGRGNIATWIVGQFGITTLAMVWVWGAGLRFLWRSGAPMRRALVCAYGLLYLVFALTTGAQVYYLGGVYVTLLAAGAVSVDGWLLAVAPSPDNAGDYAAYLRQFFTSVRAVATLSNPYGIHNIEQGGHVYLCTGPRQPWGQPWPRLRHYD